MRRTILTAIVSGVAATLALSAMAACPCQKQACQDCPSCEQVQYEPHVTTLYKTEFVDVVEKKMVPSTKFVPVVEYRDVPCSVCKELPPDPCTPAAGPCQPCQPTKCCTENGIRKVPVTVFKEVPCEKEVQVKRLVEKKTPYTITCYIPKTQPCAPEACAPACSK